MTFVHTLPALLLGTLMVGTVMAQPAAAPSRLLLPKDLNNHNTLLGLWLMGQSLCDGSESLPLVTPEDTGWGNYRFQRGVRTWVHGDNGAEPEKRRDKDFSLVPLTASVNGGLGETIANGLADHLKFAMHGFANANPNAKDPQRGKRPPHFLVAYAGQGGRTIEELAIADISTDPRTPAVKQGGGGYYKTSLDDARRAVAQAKALRKDFAIAALMWMQGEGNGGPTGGLMPTRWGTELPRAEAQAWYRDRLIAYRQQWSADLRVITGQRDEIPFFTYQTQGTAGPAQLMAADADPHIIMVGPHYMVPSAINSHWGDGTGAVRHGAAIHLSADGERWYGEQAGKVMHRVLVKGEDWQPLRPRRAWLDAKDARSSVLIDFIVPRPPLVVDKEFFPLQHYDLGKGTYSSLGGFQVREASGAIVPLSAVEVDAATRLRIRLAAPVKAGVKLQLSCGEPHAGVLGPITAVRPGPPLPKDVTTTDLEVTGDAAALLPLMKEGAFYIANQVQGAAYAQVPVRWVLTEGKRADALLLRFEDRELRNAVPFTGGQVAYLSRPFSYSNLRDSDDEQAIYNFADEGYGRRAGRPYPLWNWCVLFGGMAVDDME
ncbi:MAG: phosphate ABC transporter substrate-binding protein [Prosthecobacter sp.]